MAYKVTIEQINRVKRREQEWKKIADTGNPEDGKSKYGYVEAPEKEYTEEKTVFQQTVDDLDIPEVIKAINGMKEA